MFNKTIINEYSSPDKIEIRQFKAPTDESIRILSEMESAALGRVVEAHFIKFDNILEATSIVTHRDGALVRHWSIAFKLNGQQHVATTKITEMDWQMMKDSPRKMMEHVINEVSKAITTHFHELIHKTVIETF